MTCVNCQAETSSTYCPNCGQRMTVKRITFKEGWHDFWARVYGFDGMFPRTLKDLTLHPGAASRRFIEGNRARYYGPVGYYFLMITLMFLVASLLGIDIYQFMADRSADLNVAPPTGKGQQEFQRQMNVFIVDNLKIFAFLIIPFMAVWAKALFRKSGYNIVEHSVLVFFVLGHVYWLSILDLFLQKIASLHIHQAITFAATVLFFAYAVMDMYNYQSKPKAFFKGIAVYVLAFLSFTIFIALASVVFFVLNPETLELVRPSNNN